MLLCTIQTVFALKFIMLDNVQLLNRNQDQKEALEKMKEVDANLDGLVSWAEYLKKVYSYSLEEIATFKKDTSPEMQTFLRVGQLMEYFIIEKGNLPLGREF